MLEQNALLNETDLHEDDDPVPRRIPQTSLVQTQTPHLKNILFHEIQTKIIMTLIYLKR